MFTKSKDTKKGYGGDMGIEPSRNPVYIPEQYNYIGAFLTFNCSLQCSYCINKYGQARLKSATLPGVGWVHFLNRIETRPDLPVTLQGGEPSTHPSFTFIINNTKPSVPIDILTNLQFNVDRFIAEVNPKRLYRSAKYAPIRVSYHMETMDYSSTIKKINKLQKAGFVVGVWIVDHPRDKVAIDIVKRRFEMDGVDCRLKEFLGEYKGKLYGTYKFPEYMDGSKEACLCKPSELLISPSGHIHRCHRDLYNNIEAYQHIEDENITLPTTYLDCSNPKCNPCDVKIKTNRFQEYGHTSVDILPEEG